MKLGQLLEEGMALKPKALTEEQITRFFYRNRYKENFEELWIKKLNEFKRKWGKIYLYNKVISYPKLNVSWKIKDGKYHIVHTVTDSISPFPCLTILSSSDRNFLEKKIKSLCRYYYCKYEHLDFDKINHFTFMSLEELA